MEEETKKEETKKHLMNIFQSTNELNIDAIIEKYYTTFNYISQPARKADAIASVI